MPNGGKIKYTLKSKKKKKTAKKKTANKKK